MYKTQVLSSYTGYKNFPMTKFTDSKCHFPPRLFLFFSPFLSQQIRVNGSDYLKCDHTIADHNLEKKPNKNKKKPSLCALFYA